MAQLVILKEAVAVEVRPRSFSLRVSLLEQCPYRCPYCLPGSVVRPTEKARWLQAHEHERLAKLLVASGVRKVRFTGGEPLLRDDVEAIVSAWRRAAPEVPCALTTNGQRLLPRIAGLVAAGLSSVTVHLDTLKPHRYGLLMGDSSPSTILAACDAAQAAGLSVKVNMVVQRDKNDDELGDFLALSRRTGIEVRFIEQMNTGSAAAYTQATFLAGRDVVKRLEAVAVPRRHPADPAALFASPDGTVFGVIASDTEPFCDACDRLRLTADGHLRGCLYQSGGVALGAAIKSNAPDETLRALIDDGIAHKRSHHPDRAPHRLPFSMADVGG